MPHFVTSAQGRAHVTSANAAHWNAGTLGGGCYVLPLGNKMACTMTDSNTLRVLFGVASVCGRQWEVEGDYEEVNIDNGVPGYNRTDLLVCRIETAPQETIALKVYKGEETTGTPVTPGHVEGDLNDGDTVCEMPICSVRVNGINPQAPVMLTEESHTIEGNAIDLADLAKRLGDYMSQMLTAKGISDRGIAGAKLADGAVTSVKLAGKAVTEAKLAEALAYKVNGGGVLASPDWYMTEGQTLKLARRVSEQRTGIVLVFSAYSGSAAGNYYFSAHFVPKQAVAKANGCGWEFDQDSGDRYGMAKYLYIFDGEIRGTAVNGKSGTAPSGRRFDNAIYVLRWVIGV
ncbi:hypothetical protein [Adlercreutzia muris]|uniref:hypothetical protein n=1 Tax=Adlercreutzia muris TaxID=1796610 RepID=UPI003519B539